MLEVDIIPALKDNYIFFLKDTHTGKTGIVDPGEAAPVLKYFKQNRISHLDQIFITHHHGDHIAGCPELIEKYGCTVIGAKKDLHRIPFITQAVSENDSIFLGSAEAKIFEIPGHTSGHIAYYFKNAKALFSGDTIFSMGCGRLFEGTPEQMWQSLSKLFALPSDTYIFCAHEYTLTNAGFCIEIEPDNQDIKKRISEARSLQEKGIPTIPTQIDLERKTNTLIRATEPNVKIALGMPEADDVSVFTEIRARRDAY